MDASGNHFFVNPAIFLISLTLFVRAQREGLVARGLAGWLLEAAEDAVAHERPRGELAIHPRSH